jgi:hypothetical protein
MTDRIGLPQVTFFREWMLPWMVPTTLVIFMFAVVWFHSFGTWSDPPPIDERLSTFVNFPERSQPVVRAIEKYIADAGRPPRDLEELVPAYLPSIPETGIPRFPSYSYCLNPGGDGARGDVPWELSVRCPWSPWNRDHVIYWPTQNYERVWGKTVRLSDWLYVFDDL